MRELRLTRPIVYRGIDIWGRRCGIRISPIKDAPFGAAWEWVVNGEHIRITPELFGLSKGLLITDRTIVLRHGEHALNEFEYFGFLHAFGLRGVTVEVEGEWPPYLCSWDLLEQLRWRVVVGEALLPYRTPDATLEPGGAFERTLSYKYRGPAHGLSFKSSVNYCGPEQWGEADFAVPEDGELPWDELRCITAARSAGRPAFFKGVVWLASKVPFKPWPHAKKVLWLSGIDPPGYFVELAQHNILDLMHISFVAPEGYYLCGEIESYRAHHPLVLDLIRALAYVRTDWKEPIAA
ncbi:MAG: hypothetical protein KGI70_02220 [Patescibacteria group bacterium]|nr:hypothetical protein [Patescibacteria group bacterium]